MSIPPRPTRQDYDAALHRIHDRRRRAGDDHPLALSEDPREVLAYLRQRGHNGLRHDHTGDDITDALTLRLWLWWEGEAAELWLLQAAEALGRKRMTIAAVLGLHHGQSLIDRIKRTQRLFQRDHEPATPRLPATGPAPAGRPDDNARAIAAELIAHRGLMPTDIADDLYAEQLADALTDWRQGQPPPSSGALSALRLLLADLAATEDLDPALRELVARGAVTVAAQRV